MTAEQQSLHQLQYYIKADIMPPVRSYETSSHATEIEFVIPETVKNRPDRNFRFIKSGSGLQFGNFEYYKPNDDSLLPEVVVSLDPKYPFQRLIAPMESTREIRFAYYLLDRFYPKNQFRNMDVVIGGYRPSSRLNKKGYELKPEGGYISQKLFQQTGIDKLLAGTKYRKPSFDKPNVGIYCDIDMPVFFVGEQPNSFLYNTIYHAHGIVHDWTHVEQYRTKNVPMNSRAVEVQAITNGHNFIAAVLRSPISRSLTNRDNYLIHCLLKRGDKHIKSYLSGGAGHRTASVFKDKAGEDLILPKNVYQYGKPIKFNA